MRVSPLKRPHCAEASRHAGNSSATQAHILRAVCVCGVRECYVCVLVIVRAGVGQKEDRCAATAADGAHAVATEAHLAFSNVQRVRSGGKVRGRAPDQRPVVPAWGGNPACRLVKRGVRVVHKRPERVCSADANSVHSSQTDT